MALLQSLVPLHVGSALAFALKADEIHVIEPAILGACIARLVMIEIFFEFLLNYFFSASVNLDMKRYWFYVLLLTFQ